MFKAIQRPLRPGERINKKLSRCNWIKTTREITALEAKCRVESELKAKNMESRCHRPNLVALFGPFQGVKKALSGLLKSCSQKIVWQLDRTLPEEHIKNLKKTSLYSSQKNGKLQINQSAHARWTSIVLTQISSLKTGMSKHKLHPRLMKLCWLSFPNPDHRVRLF